MHRGMVHFPYDPMAYPVSPDTVEVVLRTPARAVVDVQLAFTDRFTPTAQPQVVPMRLTGSGDEFDYFIGRMTLKYGRFQYYFVLHTPEGVLYLGQHGVAQSPDRREPWNFGFHFPYLWWRNDGADDPPQWAQDAVIYQVFVERFGNGDTSNDPPGTGDWYDPPRTDSFAGGDLQGIIDHIDHIAELGANCLYLTPIFQSPSNHKYDTTNYSKVDPHFGDEKLARKLVDECHARGIRVVLDAVFNHSGHMFFAFQDVVARGAESPYVDWFNIDSLPVKIQPRPNYETFSVDIWTMPKLRTDNPEVQEYLLGVAEHWTRELDIDGWRLDVADEVDPVFWRAFRKRVRAIKPDMLVLGEVHHDATAFLRGDQFDSVMNYLWRRACLDYFAHRKSGTSHFAHDLLLVRTRYKRSVTYALWNLLGSHDKERILTKCGGDVSREMLAVLFQFTYVGAPYIYYGDEIGMEGPNDPGCRASMIWDRTRWNVRLLEHYRALAALRRDKPALRRGDVMALMADGPRSPLVFARWDDQSCMIVALNNTDGPATVDMNVIRQGMARNIALKQRAGGRADLVFALAPGKVGVTCTGSLLNLPAMGGAVLEIN